MFKTTFAAALVAMSLAACAQSPIPQSHDIVRTNSESRPIVRTNGESGPNGLLTTYMSRNVPQGDAWNHSEDLMTRLVLLRGGGPVDLMHVREYFFQLRHQGRIENLMNAIRHFNAGDMTGVAQYLARSHAIDTDGASIGFQPSRDGQRLFYQRYDEQTHKPMGNPLEITADGLRSLVNIQQDPAKFLAQ
jgi:hypothetical protein